MIVLTHDLETGEITGTHEIHGDPDAYIARVLETGQGAIKIGIDGGRFYVDPATGALAPRPPAGISIDRTEVSIGEDEPLTVAGLAPGARVRLAGQINQEVVAENETLALRFAVPGRYDLLVLAFPLQDFIASITVHP